MGGAQPLAATMNGACFLGMDVDPHRIERRLATGYCDRMTADLDEALRMLQEAQAAGEAISVGLVGNCADVLPELVRRGFVPDVLTDQTSAHDPLNGYVPNGMSLDDALAMRAANPDEYLTRSLAAMGVARGRDAGAAKTRGGHVRLRQQHPHAGRRRRGSKSAYDIPGFVPEYIRPLFCEGRGPFRWVALSGDPEDIYRTDRLALELFPHNETLARWIPLARKRIQFQGLPARICWLGYGERAEFGVAMNRLVRSRRIEGADRDRPRPSGCGLGVPRHIRETEAMRDGSDAIADWPLLNALVNTAAGASWISIHNGGGVGIGYSQHAGMVVVADGTAGSERRLERVLTSDPGMGVIRHADAGYPEAVGIRARARHSTSDGVLMSARALVGRQCRQLVTLAGPARPRTGAEMRELAVIADGAHDRARWRNHSHRKARGDCDPERCWKWSTPGAASCCRGSSTRTRIPCLPARAPMSYEQRVQGVTYAEIAAKRRRHSLHGTAHARGERGRSWLRARRATPNGSCAAAPRRSKRNRAMGCRSKRS